MRTPTTFLLLGLLAGALLVLVPSVAPAGEDGTASPAARPAPARDGSAPPPPPQGKEAFLEPTDPTDLIGYVKDLRREVSTFEKPPPSTPDVTVLRDAWNSILKPRARRMTKRLARWEDPKRWVVSAETGRPIGIQPARWPAFTRDMAGLATELHGAWVQLGRVRIKPKVRGTRYPPVAPRPPLAYSYGYPWPVLYGGIRARQAAGAVLGRRASISYWHLLNRFRYSWDWSWEQRQWRYAQWQKRVRATQDLFRDLREELDAARDALASDLLGLQALVAALQNTEEELLQAECIPCKTKDKTLVDMAETALEAMRDARREGERFQGASSAAYGQILRKWLRAEKAARKVLRVAEETERELAPTDEEEDPGARPASPPASPPASDGAPPK